MILKLTTDFPDSKITPEISNPAFHNVCCWQAYQQCANVRICSQTTPFGSFVGNHENAMAEPPLSDVTFAHDEIGVDDPLLRVGRYSRL